MEMQKIFVCYVYILQIYRFHLFGLTVCLIAVVMISNSILNKTGKSEHLLLFLILEEGWDFLGNRNLCLSYPSQCGPFFFCPVGAVHLLFRSFSEVNGPYVAVDLVCLWEEVSSGFSYATMGTLLFLTSLSLSVT